MSPRSRRLATAESAETPRIRATSGRVQGPRYATIASLPSAALDQSGSGGADGPCSGPFLSVVVLLRQRRRRRRGLLAGRRRLCRRRFQLEPADADRRERRRLLDRELTRAPELEHRKEGGRLLEPGHLPHLRVEVELRAPAQERAEPLEELRDGREAQGHVRERDLRRLLREHAQRPRERLGILRRELRGDLRRERRRAEAEVAVALGREPFAQPGRGLLRAPVLREPPRELLGGLLRLELGELGRLVREERPRLQLEERRDEHEELAARLEIELLPLGQPLEERGDDAREVDVAQVELLLEDQREQQVERPLERVEVELELSNDHAAERSAVTGRGPWGRPSASRWEPAASSPRASSSTGGGGTATRRRTRARGSRPRARPRS